jgi:hypothetical protein
MSAAPGRLDEQVAHCPHQSVYAVRRKPRSLSIEVRAVPGAAAKAAASDQVTGKRIGDVVDPALASPSATNATIASNRLDLLTAVAGARE